MSALLDSLAGDPFYTDSVGPQSDGTNFGSYTSLPAPPADTGGGAPFNYGQAVLDVFKLGVGAWSADNTQKNLLDYKRYETTAAGTYQQGRGALLASSASGGLSPMAWLLILGGIVLVVSTHKG